MNADSEKTKALLDDLLSGADEGVGPGRAALLKMVGQERTRRKHRRALTAVAGLVIVGALLQVGYRHAAPPAMVATTPDSKPVPPVVIKQVNDEQLFQLLKDTPAAIMEWPNGERTLLIVGR